MLPGSFCSKNDVGHCTVTPLWEHNCGVHSKDHGPHTSENNKTKVLRSHLNNRTYVNAITSPRQPREAGKNG